MSWLARKLNLTVTKYDKLQALRKSAGAQFDLKFLHAMPDASRKRCLDLLGQSKSQIRQDLFALAHLDFPRDGYFVEFGATDGVDLNNTWLMEKEFGWKGILAEPARGWHAALKSNRDAVIETRCVWSKSGEQLDFTEAPRGENSGVSSYVLKSRRLRGTTYKVETISLVDMLDAHDAPSVIDFGSVDTEGTELDILSAFDFNRYRFRVLVVEHNHAPQREEIHKLLTGHGYRRVLTELSQWDDWYLSDD